MYDPSTMMKQNDKSYLSKSLLLWDDGSRPHKVVVDIKEEHLGNVSVIINSPSVTMRINSPPSPSDMSISPLSSKNIVIEEDKYDYGLSLNIIKSICGIGILGIPYTVKQSGYSFMIIMFIIAIITGYNATNIGKLVMDLKKLEKYKNVHLTYFNISEEVYDYKLKTFVQIIWSIEIICCCILIINLSFTFMHQIFDLTDNIYLLCSFIIFFYCLTFIKNYNKIKILSSFGLTAIFLLFCFLIYNLIKFYLQNNLSFSDSINNKHHTFIHYKNIPKSIAITLFCFGGHVIFPEIFSSTKNLKKLKKNIIYTWSLYTSFVVTFILISFVLFGDSISDDIINNLDESYWFKKIIISLLLINIVFTFPLMFTPLNLRIILNIKSLNINKSLKIFLYRYFIRFCLILIICIIGFYWKSYLNIMSVVGGFLENTTSIILPSVLTLKYFKLNLFEKILNILIIEFGIILLGFTLYDSYYILK